MQSTESINEALVKKLCEFLALLIRETGIHAICLRILQVYLLMSNVHVTTYDDWFLGIKCLEICSEVILPCHAVVKSAKTILRVRGIDGNEIELLVFKGDNATFMVMFIYPHTITNAQWGMFSIDSGA